MLNHKPCRAIFFLVATAVMFLEILASPEIGYAGLPGQTDCGSYYESRVAYLLGCCGDVVGNYPGPVFPGSLDNVQRGELALAEIDSATRRDCTNPRSAAALGMVLDKAGAHLLRAEALASKAVTQKGESRAALSAADDAVAAVSILKDFTSEHPAESSKLWGWIATAFWRAGNPWQALAFVSTLSAACCDEREIARFKGDVLFDLGILDSASFAYSQWLSGASPSLYCGEERSLQNAKELRLRGFAIPEASLQLGGSCGQADGWRPYIFLRTKGGVAHL